ncbi:hypothetical protein [Inhella proteolytica]|uniref:hypothetical protein n=1 Tax=Inhella proteolytica TaxID=2795029 RepID=UPI0018DD93FD|nr:hypothetical protein [Inhella proteolytica]
MNPLLLGRHRALVWMSARAVTASAAPPVGGESQTLLGDIELLLLELRLQMNAEEPIWQVDTDLPAELQHAALRHAAERLQSDVDRLRSTQPTAIELAWRALHEKVFNLAQLIRAHVESEQAAMNGTSTPSQRNSTRWIDAPLSIDLARSSLLTGGRALILMSQCCTARELSLLLRTLQCHGQADEFRTAWSIVEQHTSQENWRRIAPSMWAFQDTLPMIHSQD